MAPTLPFNLRSFVLPALLGLLVIAGVSCSRIPVVGDWYEKWKGSGEAEAPSLEFKMELQRTDHLPGMPVVLGVLVYNVGDEAVSAQWPDVSSVVFRVAGPGGAGVQVVRPVHSSLEQLGQMRTLKPGDFWRRPFVFTLLTKEEGDFRIQATYYPTPRGAVSDLEPITTEGIAFRVSGQRFIRRDNDGIVLEADAIAVAKRELGRPTVEARAILLMNDKAGFYDWWITLKIDPEALQEGENPYKAYFVSPYLGTIVRSREAKPYIPPQANVPAKQPPSRPRP